MKWSKRLGEVDRERKVWSTCFTHFWLLPLWGHWVPLGTARSVLNPLQPPLLGIPSIVRRRLETAKPGLTLVSHLFCAYLAFNQSLMQAHQRVSKVEQKMYLLGEQKNQSSKCPSVQFSRSAVSDFLRPHGLQHTRLPCPSPTPKAYSNLCPSSQ